MSTSMTPTSPFRPNAVSSRTRKLVMRFRVRVEHYVRVGFVKSPRRWSREAESACFIVEGPDGLLSSSMFGDRVDHDDGRKAP
jgi:hypothetical protein